ncbi:putative nuclease HARBI1 isoform X2 [Eupeodes corollae]|uniref:putative nuclease HARBI1 isoform X2 n=1 Tax=Eupeodes corollae TaxID=290404 RepID=UPI00249036B8|nr:putative nuclease HARBI1 isoform X2 [Eupeodes corollae]
MEEKSIIIAATSVLILTRICLRRRRKMKRRLFWVNPYLQGRSSFGRFNDFDDMMNYPASFRENFHMSYEQFHYIYDKIETHLKPVKYSRADIIPAKAKLAMVLEFLACGSLQRHIASVYRVSKQAFGLIVDQVCIAICTEMSDEMPKMRKTNWLEVANKFNARWNFPNCVGAIDGKHIAIKCPKNAGSLFYNYKKFHSIVLMAVADAQYRFIYIDVGAYGSEGDASVFLTSSFGRSIVQNTIALPESTYIGCNQMPFVFVGDDAFPLSERIMKPYTPQRGANLSDSETIFNYRLSRARRCVENSFGILVAKFACLSRTLFCGPERAQKITSACYRYDVDGRLIEGEWRNKVQNIIHLDRSSQRQSRPNESSKKTRDVFKEFVNSNDGSLPWQRTAVFL